MYEASNGGKVVKSYAGTSKEEKQNFDAAKILADKKGWTVDLKGISQKGKSCDASINGEDWEIKTNFTPTKSAVENAIKGAKGQARNIILHIQSDINVKDVIYVVKNRVKRSSWLDKVLIITKRDILININK